MISQIVDHILSHTTLDGTWSDEILTEIARSIETIPVTRHPLGFVHYDLSGVANLPSKGFARLHIWDQTIAPTDPAGNIHDHTWHLTSAILVGALRDRTFTPRPNPKGSLSAVRVRYGKTNDFLPAGRYDLVGLTDRVFTKGEIYRIPSRVVHESEPLEQPTVTFVVGVPDASAAVSGPLILSRFAQVPAGTAIREAISQKEALALLGDMRDAVRP